MWWEVITDALLDTLKLCPFLLLLYILIELMEHNTKIGKPNGLLASKAAPFIGAATGLVPMCGFSVMAAKLYEHKRLTLGTLLAVFIATSDEAFLVLLFSSMGWIEKLISILLTCGIKILLGVLVGYFCDLVVKRRQPLAPMPQAEAHEHMHAHEHEHMHEGADEGEMHDIGAQTHMHEHEHEEGEAHGEYSVCEHKHGKRGTLSLYLVSPLLHALKIAAFILVFNLAFGYLFFGIGGGSVEVGQERVIGFLQGAGYWYQPLASVVVGLVPNCVSSVALAETYAVAGIAFGSFVGGLVTNAGLGYLVLFRKKTGVKKALAVIAFMAALGVAVAYAINGILLLI